MKYQVGIKIYNCFTVEADSEQEAEEKVRDFSVHETLDDADYNITYVHPDELSKEEVALLYEHGGISGIADGCDNHIPGRE